jgi:hypothetical protein
LRRDNTGFRGRTTGERTNCFEELPFKKTMKESKSATDAEGLSADEQKLGESNGLATTRIQIP